VRDFVGHVTDAKKLRVQLIALIRRGRTFGHQDTPLRWHEVRRLKTEGCRRLAQVYGDGSPNEAIFVYHMEKAFLPLYTWRKEDRVDKAGSDVLVINPDDVPGLKVDLNQLNLGDEADTEDRVFHVNKLDLGDALRTLREAADRLGKGTGQDYSLTQAASLTHPPTIARRRFSPGQVLPESASQALPAGCVPHAEAPRGQETKHRT
jgi:hypothetical protein